MEGEVGHGGARGKDFEFILSTVGFLKANDIGAAQNPMELGKSGKSSGLFGVKKACAVPGGEAETGPSTGPPVTPTR